MARQFTDEERERMARGGEWLRRERKRRGFEHGTDFAEALGLRQVRVSAYERGLYPVPDTVARTIARVLDLSELETWKGLELPLPSEVASDEALDEYYESKYPDVFKGVERRTGLKVT